MSCEPPKPWAEWPLLLRAVGTGDPEAINDLATAIGAMARRFFLGKGLPLAEAEAQAVTCITETWLRLDRFQGDNFPAWTHTVFLHLFIDDFRRRRRSVQGEHHTHFETFAASHVSPQPDSRVRSAVGMALKTLKPVDQLILQLRHCAQPLEYGDIAAELHMESGAVRTRYSRAAKRVAKILRADPRMEARIAGHSRKTKPRTGEPGHHETLYEAVAPTP